jgi:hypothetical protein
MVAIDAFELFLALLLAVEKLQHGDSRDMLLQVGVDSSDGHADAAVTLRSGAPELYGYQQNERHHRQHQAGHSGAELQHGDDYECEHQDIAHDGDQPGSEQIVQNVDVGSHARDQSADRILVEIRYVQRLQVRDELAAQVEHRALPGPLHQIRLAEIEKEPEHDHSEIEQTQLSESRPGIV